MTRAKRSTTPWYVLSGDTVVEMGKTLAGAKAWAVANAGRFEAPLTVACLGSSVRWQRVAGRWWRADGGAARKPPVQSSPYFD